MGAAVKLESSVERFVHAPVRKMLSECFQLGILWRRRRPMAMKIAKETMDWPHVTLSPLAHIGWRPAHRPTVDL